MKLDIVDRETAEKTATNQQTVEILEDLLRRAQAGEILEIVACANGSDNTVHVVFSSTRSIIDRLGMLELAKFDILSKAG